MAARPADQDIRQITSCRSDPLRLGTHEEAAALRFNPEGFAAFRFDVIEASPLCPALRLCYFSGSRRFRFVAFLPRVGLPAAQFFFMPAVDDTRPFRSWRGIQCRFWPHGFKM
jgi:hypothetical protein